MGLVRVVEKWSLLLIGLVVVIVAYISFNIFADEFKEYYLRMGDWVSYILIFIFIIFIFWILKWLLMWEIRIQEDRSEQEYRSKIRRRRR